MLLALERFRARALADRLGTAASETGSGDPHGQALRDRLGWLQRRANRLRDQGEDVTALERDIHLLETQWQEAMRRQHLVAAGDAGAAADAATGSRQLLDVAAWQQRLPPGAAIVEYGVLDDELFACVLTGNQIVVQRNLCSWTAVLAALDRVDIQFDSMRLGNILPERHIAQLTARAQNILRQLHALIWAPLAHYLSGINQVAVVPHGRLGSLQFATLFDGQTYLGEQLLLATAPSAAAVAHCVKAAPATLMHALVLADSERLQHAMTEAAALAARISNCTTLSGSEATATALRQHAPGAQLIHLACHGVFRSDNPVFSAIELADGNFAATDVERLRLAGAVVVLSACESGSASIAEGDEVFGLVRAWLIAGAARVVASRWPVGDAIAAEWMNHFYDALLAGATPAAATRVAQARVRAKFPHPAQWGAFSLFGAW